MVFGHDSRTVVAADHLEATIRIFDVATGKERAAYRLQQDHAADSWECMEFIPPFGEWNFSLCEGAIMCLPQMNP